MSIRVLCILWISFFAAEAAKSQALDSSLSLNRKSFSPPRKAALRSAILPGWGQATNKKYWKIPLVYGALGTTGYLFNRNLQQYRDSRDAYRLAMDNDPSNDILIKQPYYNVRSQPERIRNFRNAVRQNLDYCVLGFLVCWGLNVMDATVDAHLKTFDVSDNLSLRLKGGYNEIGQTAGLGISLQFKGIRHQLSK